MKKIGMGLVGPGFIATHHIDAVRRLGDVEVIAIAGSSARSAALKASQLHVDKSYGDFKELLENPDVQVVHNTTPNHLHFEVSMAAIRAGKHVISDKPLGMNATQSRDLYHAALEAGIAHVVTFNYRGNPLVQQARVMLARGDVGRPTFIHGHYLQDWLSSDSVYSWRSDPSRGGASSALGDIGSHWCDLAEHVIGARIVSVLADLSTVIPVRYGAESPDQPISMVSEDLATVLLRFDNGSRGVFSVGQVLHGHKNDLQLEVCGSAASLRWRQEEPNELWIGNFAKPESKLTKDPLQLPGEPGRYVRLPAGHQQGWSDAFFNVMADAYHWIREGAGPAARPAATATFLDGYRASCLVDAMLASHAAGNRWQEVAFEPSIEGRRAEF